MVCERPPAAFGGSPPREGETRAKRARGSLTHHLGSGYGNNSTVLSYFLSSKIHQFFHDLDDSLRLKTKFPLELLKRGRGSKHSHADDAAEWPDVTLPAKGRCLLDRDTQFHRRRQHAVTILKSLVIKDVPRRHRNNARPNALQKQRFVCIYSQTDFTARCDQNDLRVPSRRIGKHISAARHSGCRRVFGAIQSRKRLPRQSKHGRHMTQLHHISVSLDYFIGISRPQRDQSRDRSQRRELFYGLMCWSIFSVPHRIVSEYVNRRQFH